MSTATLDADPAHQGGSLTDDQGRTTIDDGVVEKIAARAIGEIDGVGGVANRVLGVQIGADEADRRPRVRARVDGTIVTLEVTLSVTYPSPVGQVTQRVRDHVTERVSTLTGLSTRVVDITVTALNHPPAAHRELR